MRWKWRELARISPYLRHAVVASEDAKFWSHEGVDWEAMEQVAKETREKKSMGRGGSTITPVGLPTICQIAICRFSGTWRRFGSYN